MKQVDEFFSVPYLLITKQFEILQYSTEVEDIFVMHHNFLKMCDEESVHKVRKEVVPGKSKNKIEINLVPSSANHDLLLVDLYVNWKNDLHAEMMILPKDQGMLDVTASLGQLRSRLNTTNFELLEEKEKLQEAMAENNRLSAPFIELSSTTALVPLFGDLNAEKINAVGDELLTSAQQSDIETILFDLTAVGEIEQDGVIAFQGVVQSLAYMGMEIVVIGVKPDHAQRINDLQLKLGLKFLRSLQQAIRKYCN
ncbi:STAS domain-containing protein [Thalassobacillus sp. B23F22_16]|uniref:STAS domain-containing protein n=1 Tax=Thalassobacillus sp. B23F22_16 TaxID=3459513 RepID=UPI00373F72DF